MKDLGGGAVLDLAVYMLQLVQFIYKEPPTDIVCTGHLSKAGVDESISCALKYKDGRTATLSAHTRATMTNKADIIGTKGAIVVSARCFGFICVATRAIYCMHFKFAFTCLQRL